MDFFPNDNAFPLMKNENIMYLPVISIRGGLFLFASAHSVLLLFLIVLQRRLADACKFLRTFPVKRCENRTRLLRNIVLKNELESDPQRILDLRVERRCSFNRPFYLWSGTLFDVCYVIRNKKGKNKFAKILWNVRLITSTTDLV